MSVRVCEELICEERESVCVKWACVRLNARNILVRLFSPRRFRSKDTFWMGKKVAKKMWQNFWSFVTNKWIGKKIQHCQFFFRKRFKNYFGSNFCFSFDSNKMSEYFLRFSEFEVSFCFSSWVTWNFSFQVIKSAAVRFLIFGLLWWFASWMKLFCFVFSIFKKNCILGITVSYFAKS